MKAGRRNVNVVIADDERRLATAATQALVSCAAEALEARGRFCAAIASDMPAAFYRHMCRSSSARALRWDRIHLFRADLCCGPACPTNCIQDPSTWRLIHKIGIPASSLHRICAGKGNCGCVATAYEQTIRDVVRARKNGIPSFDLVILAMGADGHIASLFNDNYAFFDTDRCVRVIHFMDERKTRITLTNPVLRAASNIVVLVCGRDKAPMLREILTSEPDEVRYPLHAVWPVLDRVTWLVDRRAGSFLIPADRSRSSTAPNSHPSGYAGGSN